ncbi:retrovirus-related Pol polyprotein from transposon TNT 1-94 [Trichonephila inaurata madagascariensis]|uniref:Retrovirus-related Pol polyprotein from transposon TNT 1-94 n=1 Tax=Trichonephila inaurata madagascariensis TaxID=2747483 RepID=A0A8X6YYB3_9ARAC|nr:retrovirus-related Pol polyprotein from transposon TNT 1-94 [Trichonephila inaurata madagascariensis]
MIRSLPGDFRSTVQAIYRWSDKDFVPDKIEAELLLEENRLGVVKKDLEDVNTFAFYDKVKRKIKKQKSQFKSKNFDVLIIIQVAENINIRFDEGKRGVDSEKTFTGPVRNYFLKYFPEDGDIFSAVGDRADHPEADSERDIRPGSAGSESQTGRTHTLGPCASIPWIRKPVERKDRSRTDIYYFVEGSNVRLRSFNKVQKYCKDNNIGYEQNLFNFSGKNSSSGKVTDLLNFPLKEETNLAEVRIPKTYREATRTPEAADWEGAMDKEMQVMYDRKVWNIVEPTKEAKVLGCRWVYSLKRNE